MEQGLCSMGLSATVVEALTFERPTCRFVRVADYTSGGAQVLLYQNYPISLK